MSRNKKGSLERILKVLPSRDEQNDRFIPYCDFGFHQGVCKNKYHLVCEARSCKYYIRLYITENTPWTKDLNTP